MSKQRKDQEIALQGSMRAVTQISAKGEPKIGVDEFMALCTRFGLSKKTLDRIRKAVNEEDWGEGPFLANYYSGLKESCVQAFQRTARELFGSPYAIGTSSGTGALHGAFVAVGAGPGTEVICPAIGFIATANAASLAGATPVFCDVDESMHMDPNKIEALITKRTVALAPTHAMGGVSDMDAIMRIARKHKLAVVEDCAQSCGARYKGRMCGTIGDVGIFSISAYKIVGAGEGGLILAKTKRLWERASQLVEAGGLWRPVRFAPPRYRGELFTGTNYRMSELEAAMDVVQLKKMPRTVKRFQKVKAAILKRLQRFTEITPQVLNDPDGEVGYTLRFYPDTIARGECILAALHDRKIQAGMRGKKADDDWHCYSFMHPMMVQYPIRRGDCPVADDLFDRVITISLNQWYTPADCKAIADRINEALATCCTIDPKAKAWR
ncbi:MAG: DegT/DnrJ/EryC1/StrS family aminotransferase [Candidatus Hydrogenedentes bacterium]|nr:DegT/DnrJ/EryC1/StrS family aminotransferase [Candidatus Hydrogenedentota bacterium]